jgi:hypothetical protein
MQLENKSLEICSFILVLDRLVEFGYDLVHCDVGTYTRTVDASHAAFPLRVA